MDDVLMNFRIPTDLKDNFSTVCRVNRTTMTFELIWLVKSYLDDERVKLETSLRNRDQLKALVDKSSPEKQEQRPERWGQYVKNDATGAWELVGDQ